MMYVSTMVNGALGFVGSEIVRRGIDHGNGWTTDAYNKLKGLFVPDEKVLKVFNNFNHIDGFGNFPNKTEASMRAEFDVNNHYKVFGQLGLGLGNGSMNHTLGMKFQIQPNLMVGFAITPMSTIKLMVEHEFILRGLKAFGSLSYNKDEKVVIPAVNLSYKDAFALELATKNREEIQGHGKICVGKYLLFDGDIMYPISDTTKAADATFGCAVNMKDVNVHVSTEFEIGDNVKLDSVGVEIAKKFKGTSYRIIGKTNKDLTGVRISFGWTTK